jgi:peptide chain release factor 1
MLEKVVELLNSEQGADYLRALKVVFLAFFAVAALAVLAARIQDVQQRARQQKEAAERKSLIGSGDRSERIRTYNFPQSRVTDHRYGITRYDLAQVMSGERFGDLVEEILSKDIEQRLAEELQ